MQMCDMTPSDDWHDLFKYGLATVSRLLKFSGLFCRMSSVLWGSFAKGTYNFKEPTNCSHPICVKARSEVWSVGSLSSDVWYDYMYFTCVA